MTKKSLGELTDVALPDEEQVMIRNILENYPGVKDYHLLRTRRSGSKRLVDVHVVLEADLQLQQAHDICDDIEMRIKELFSPCDVIIHPEPFDDSSAEIP